MTDADAHNAASATPANLGALSPALLTGNEPFTGEGAPAGGTVLDLWRWIGSDLVGNTFRGLLAEYLVARAVGGDVLPRDAWATYDVEDPRGVKIEVKSAAYLQSWGQKQLSSVSFAYPARMALDEELGTYAGDAVRSADVYVFALLAHTDKPTVDPLNLDQWEFYVVPTQWLNERARSQSSIGLAALQASEFGEAVRYGELAEVIGVRASRR